MKLMRQTIGGAPEHGKRAHHCPCHSAPRRGPRVIECRGRANTSFGAFTYSQCGRFVSDALKLQVGRDREKVKSSLLKLDDVAKRLGCHFETLRLRIRSGRLEAVRGPHRAYFISATSLRVLLVRK